MIDVIIYRPTKTATQSGRFKTHNWVVEFERKSACYIEPLMRWTSSRDTQMQTTMRFKTLQEALYFAQMQGWTYRINRPHKPMVKSKSYADNFKKFNV